MLKTGLYIIGLIVVVLHVEFEIGCCLSWYQTTNATLVIPASAGLFVFMFRHLDNQITAFSKQFTDKTFIRSLSNVSYVYPFRCILSNDDDGVQGTDKTLIRSLPMYPMFC